MAASVLETSPLEIAPAPQFFTTDYDGTTHLTSELSPDGIGVDEAYKLALAEQLDPEAASRYVLQGGHNHRTPYEIVQAVLPDVDGDELDLLSARVTAAKLEILMSQIGKKLPDGTRWPRTTDGFILFWEQLNRLKARGLPIGTAIISAGHTVFERRTFEMLGLAPPDVFMTNDALRALCLNVPPDEQVKPHPRIMRLTQQILHTTLNLPTTTSPQGISTLHIGDDPVKDGGLAKNSDTNFILLDPEQAQVAWRSAARLLGLGKFIVRAV